MISISRRQKQHIGLQFVFDLTAPKSAYGKEMLRNAKCFTPEQKNELQRQLDNIEKTMLHRPRLEPEYSRIEQVFSRVKDIRKSIQKCRGGILGEIDLFEIKCYLLQLTEIAALFARVNSQADYNGISFRDTAEALQLLDPEQNRVATFHISNSYSRELAQIRMQKKDIEEKMRQYSFKDVPAALMEQRQSLAEAEEKEEEKVRAELSRKLEPFIPPLLANAGTIGELDLVIQKAAIADKYHAAKPQLGEKKVSFSGMWNPQIAALLQEQGREFTAITIELDKGATVITGANMGGKSVALATTALNIILLHYGYFPFASESLSPLFDSMHIISGSLESKEHGLSSFGGEIIGLNEIASSLEQGFACVLIDEFARGTNPEEGAAIAQGVTEYLNGKNAVALISTHYDKVAEHANVHYQIVGLSKLDLEELKKETSSLENSDKVHLIARHMNYNLVMVNNKQKPPHEALNVCYLLGMPHEIIDKIQKNY